MTNNNNITQTLSLNGVTIHSVPETNGMFDLTDFWKAYTGKDKKKKPSQWRTKVAKHYIEMQKLHLKAYQGQGKNQTLGTQEVVIAYAMWLDLSFYSAVVSAFATIITDESLKEKVVTALVKDNKPTEARIVACSESFKSDRRDAFDNLKGLRNARYEHKLLIK
ncbi:KilA-N domain-containing protein [Vibrio aestuarianus]|uniref:KilA-N domain-containing protein n=1 Tax=Vibrio aestuarianus TaxID=28171 RepID=A0ABM9FNQ7_9VIBR|nr:KilA-N domain-containing protein [Vibrio aestuarianus]MDE1227699.1 KilA-N domain-containing protein [Vibrio aestuarianus]MDE1256169.1 KilA-N domain-containing protein [Vibrio aestuarianus]MDE1270847.1 KilA-N domain-containing protein [Vibrio aestuarianus]MDE1292279.1 KilA-N domain-containing protein [Vibrio aestuarianus]MDE1306069.1 KilA-N domain-containing protein [Vibrio aestuarianus]